MPYFVYRIASDKSLQLLDQFETFPAAKDFAREQRAAQTTTDAGTVKVMFAKDSNEAEQQLGQPRNAPILMEHEK